MNNYSALPDDLRFPYESDECIQVTVESVTEKLRGIDKFIRQVVRMVYRLGC
jgi:hypothetical protein